ncbi:uncharacterized protein LOC122843592 isoform X2 [Gambusia affinis]|uniref:uncharacterized protein LOC122843592 isoform X2 n=1 Tax=Gambusia affinis TaxID=33528 RepID=UPI001CDB4C14|nr:uncharacterized protein LOC122843592 isoform X2 [Gambusia affinis]
MGPRYGGQTRTRSTGSTGSTGWGQRRCGCGAVPHFKPKANFSLTLTARCPPPSPPAAAAGPVTQSFLLLLFLASKTDPALQARSLGAKNKVQSVWVQRANRAGPTAAGCLHRNHSPERSTLSRDAGGKPRWRNLMVLSVQVQRRRTHCQATFKGAEKHFTDERRGRKRSAFKTDPNE